MTEMLLDSCGSKVMISYSYAWPVIYLEEYGVRVSRRNVTYKGISRCAEDFHFE